MPGGPPDAPTIPRDVGALPCAEVPMPVAVDRADLLEALAHAAASPVRDWRWIDALLDDYLAMVRGT